MAVLALIFLVASLLFRVLDVLSGNYILKHLALVSQAIAILVASIPILCKSILPNIDKIFSMDLSSRRFLNSNVSDWLVLRDPHSDDLHFPAFYYYADHELLLLPDCHIDPFVVDWEEKMVEKLPIPSSGRTCFVRYKMEYYGQNQKTMFALFMDQLRFCIPYPAVSSDLENLNNLECSEFDYKMSEILDLYVEERHSFVDMYQAVSKLNMIKVKNS